MARACLLCHASLDGRRSDARWCSSLHRAAWLRLEARRRALLAQPRCVICSGPMPYGKPGFNLRASACSEPCHVKRHNWFRSASTANKGHCAVCGDPLLAYNRAAIYCGSRCRMRFYRERDRMIGLEIARMVHANVALAAVLFQGATA